MRSWLVPLLLTVAVLFPAAAQVPFAENIAPKLSFTENYTEVVRAVTVEGETDYEIIPDTTLIIHAEVSMQGFDLATINSETVFSIEIGDLSLEVLLGEDEEFDPLVDTSVSVPIFGTDPITFLDEKVGDISVRWSATKLIVDISLPDHPEEYSITAPTYAGTLSDSIAQVSVVTMTFGDRILDTRSVYVSGTAEFYEMEVGPADDRQTFSDLSKVRLTGAIDSEKPNVAIVSPPRNSPKIRTEPFLATGTTADNVAIAVVNVSLNGGPAVQADLANGIWSTSLDLEVGENTLQVEAIDQDGNTQTTSRSFDFIPFVNVTINAAGDGSGTVSGAIVSPTIQYSPAATSVERVTSQEQLASLAALATPGPGSVFDGWEANPPNVLTNPGSRLLRFNAQPGMVVTARFNPNPNVDKAGNYTGLITSDDPLGRGYFTLKLNSQSTFTGSIKIGAFTLPIKGGFTSLSRFEHTFTKSGVNYTVSLRIRVLADGAEQIFGTISGGGLDAEIMSDIAAFKKPAPLAPQAGTYNVLLRLPSPPPDPLDPNFPFGIGYGRVTVGPTGLAKFAGKLGDSTNLSFGTLISKSGVWPFFASLYKKRGSISGSVIFDSTQPGHDLLGTLEWFRPGPLPGKVAKGVHGDGFAGQCELIGARFEKVVGVTQFLAGSGRSGIFSLDAPEARNSKGTLLPAFTTNPEPGLPDDPTATLGVDNKLTVSDAALGVKCKVKASTGLFSGSFEEFEAPLGKNVTYKFSGAVVPAKLNEAGGLFVRGDRTGAVQVTPPAP